MAAGWNEVSMGLTGNKRFFVTAPNRGLAEQKALGLLNRWLLSTFNASVAAQIGGSLAAIPDGNVSIVHEYIDRDAGHSYIWEVVFLFCETVYL